MLAFVYVVLAVALRFVIALRWFALPFHFTPVGASLLGVAPDTNLADEYARGAWTVFEEGKQLPRERYPLARAARGERVYPHEIEVVMPTGRRMTMLSSASPFADAAGKTVGAVAQIAQNRLEPLRRPVAEVSDGAAGESRQIGHEW